MRSGRKRGEMAYLSSGKSSFLISVDSNEREKVAHPAISQKRGGDSPIEGDEIGVDSDEKGKNKHP